MKPLPVVLAFALAVTAFAADEEEKHPIDRKIAAAEEKAVSTAEMRQVYVDGLKAWDAELNRVYGELKKKLKPNTFAVLQSAQRQWIVYRDEQMKFISSMYAEFDGTMYIPMRASAEMEITRARALELWRQLQVVSDHAQ